MMTMTIMKIMFRLMSAHLTKDSIHAWNTVWHSGHKKFVWTLLAELLLGLDLPSSIVAFQSKCWIIKLVPIKTLQSLHAKFRVLNEGFETNLDCTIISRNQSFVCRLFPLNRYSRTKVMHNWKWRREIPWATFCLKRKNLFLTVYHLNKGMITCVT